MKRLTNPTLTFEVPSPILKNGESWFEAENKKVIFKQGTQIIFYKEPEQNKNIFTVTLGPDDTGKLSPGVVKIELSFIANNKNYISDIITANVEDVLRTDWN